ncbi:PDZ domain-containing protein [Sphingomonas sp. HDW15A]|uniref:aspartyl protease family protein n=1 Tax=Sphingomonas sp. HDW15A TaxID=2714942 RepID=UPI00140C21A1|nr:aspartyl protease family protein [Sphingomonas sp. HDW15A]QIK96666.1 PDZ domain-containing protein [Sphingomonas sp. HDW15A]
MLLIRHCVLALSLLLGFPNVSVAQIAPPKVSFQEQKPGAEHFDLYRDTRIFLDGGINGRKTPMLLDSGASVTVIDRAFAVTLGLKGGTPIGVQGAGGSERGELYRGISVTVGNLSFRDLTVAAMDLSLVERALGRKVPVVLGREAFMNSVVTIDFDRQEISFAPRGGFTPPSNAAAIALRRRGALHTLSIRIGDLPPHDAIFDLGNSGAISLSQEYHRSQPYFATLPSATGMSGGVGGLHEVRRITLPSVEIAGVRFDQVPAQLGGLANGPYSGMINAGIQLFRPFVLTLDLAGDRMWLQRTAAPVVFSRDRAGLFVTFEGDHYAIRHVTADGPAAKSGLKVGDDIVSVGGRRVNAAFPNSPEAEWLFGRAGTPVEIGLADGRSVTVTLADFY